MTPARLTSPRVGRMPTRLFAEAGERIDWPVSLPVPSSAMFAAIATPVPPLDPPGVRVRSYGFSTCPPRLLIDMPPRANSCRFALARISAPALRIFATVGASRGRNGVLMLTLPAVVGMSTVSKLSFSTIGNAVERARSTRVRRPLAVQLRGRFQRLRVDREDRAQARALAGCRPRCDRGRRASAARRSVPLSRARHGRSRSWLPRGEMACVQSRRTPTRRRSIRALPAIPS